MGKSSPDVGLGILTAAEGFLRKMSRLEKEPRSDHNSILFTFHNPEPWKKSAFFNKRTMKVGVSGF